MSIITDRIKANQSLQNAVVKTEQMNTRPVVNIPVDQIEETPDNEKTFGYDPEEIDNLSFEIENHGFTGAIDVVKTGVNKYQVFSGHQCLLAVKKLGWQTIPCIVSEDLSHDELIRKMLAGNILSRKMSPLAYARAIKLYEEEVLSIPGSKPKGMRTREAEAKFFGVGEGQIQRYKAILLMPEEIQELCKNRDFPYSYLIDAVTFSQEDMQLLSDRILEYIGKNEVITGEALKQIIANVKNKPEEKKTNKEGGKLRKRNELKYIESIDQMVREISPENLESTQDVREAITKLTSLISEINSKVQSLYQQRPLY